MYTTCVRACMHVIMCEASKLLSVYNITRPPFSGLPFPLPLPLHPSLHQLPSLVLRSTSTDAWINVRGDSSLLYIESGPLADPPFLQLDHSPDQL